MDATARPFDDQLSNVPLDERDIYAPDRAFGRFGVRQFRPKVMDRPHWHGHVEFNFLSGTGMTYDYDGQTIHVPAGQPVMFWAGVPHYVTALDNPKSDRATQLNIYVPVDTFLLMPSISMLQVAALGGAVVALPTDILGHDLLKRWARDEKSGNPELREIVKEELALALRRAQLTDLVHLGEAPDVSAHKSRVGSRQITRLVDMVRFILENLEAPLNTADVAEHVGFHPNYASSLFARVLRVPMKRFIIRMRLLRARAILIQGTQTVAEVATVSGFSSMTQFYEHFKAAYGMSPRAMRAHYSGSY